MAGGSGGGEKTEKATPQRLKKARREGQIGNSPELGTWLGILAASFLLPALAQRLMAAARQSFVAGMGTLGRPDPGTAVGLLKDAVWPSISLLLPLTAAIIVLAVAGAASQSGLRVTTRLWAPKASRVNPFQGLKRMFGPQGLWQLTKALLKTLAVGVVVYVAVRGLVPTLVTSGTLSIAALLEIAGRTVIRVLQWAAVAGIALAVADWAVTRRRNNKSLRMSKQEVKDENKSQEGDPALKSARRARQLALSRNRMIAEVPRADVIVTNPTHLAVALRYEASRGAPRVVASGMDHLAEQIRRVATDHRVPIVEDVPLARTLYATCAVGQEIPAELYQAVAHILAFLMRLRAKGSAAGHHRSPPMPPGARSGVRAVRDRLRERGRIDL